jgi:hypothetical protein
MANWTLEECRAELTPIDSLVCCLIDSLRGSTHDYLEQRVDRRIVKPRLHNRNKMLLKLPKQAATPTIKQVSGHFRAFGLDRGLHVGGSGLSSGN